MNDEEKQEKLNRDSKFILTIFPEYDVDVIQTGNLSLYLTLKN